MTAPLAEQVLTKAVRDGIERTVEGMLDRRANGKGPCSRKTRDERRAFYPLMVAQLWQLGYRIRKLESLSGKHIQALMTFWHQEKLVAGTLRSRLSWINTLCTHMGKKGVCLRCSEYLPEEAIRRSTVATESKAWKAKGVKPEEIIELARQIDERFAVMLALQYYFGLRVKESIELRPMDMVVGNAQGGQSLEIHEGTKGGRPRLVPVETAAQADVIAWARSVAVRGSTKRLRWTDCTWKQAQNRFYNWARKRLGLTKKILGVTCHGLRHSYVQAAYRRQTGFPSPIEGGALGKIDRETHDRGCITVAHAVGHGRRDVTPSYYGSYGHSLRNTSVQMSYSPLAISLPA